MMMKGANTTLEVASWYPRRNGAARQVSSRTMALGISSPLNSTVKTLCFSCVFSQDVFYLAESLIKKGH